MAMCTEWLLLLTALQIGPSAYTFPDGNLPARYSAGDAAEQTPPGPPLQRGGSRQRELDAPADRRFAAAESEEVPSFQRHVVPLLGRLGCNGRACHGSF